MWPVTWRRPGRPGAMSPRCRKRTKGWQLALTCPMRPRRKTARSARRPPSHARARPHGPSQGPGAADVSPEPGSEVAEADAQAPDTDKGDKKETARAVPRPSRRSTSASTAAAASHAAADVSAGAAAVRRRLARLGAARGGGVNPVLEPLIKTVRTTHPKADVRLIERAYDTAARMHAGQARRSGDPFITHPLAVATILAELGMNHETIARAAARHDRGHRLHPRSAAPRVRRRHRRAGGWRHQAGQGQVR